MKVPKMYKSSDRYNAGTDVIYDDDSKLEYAPFIYAGVTAKDNGEGGDEEGEDVMVVKYDGTKLDKSYKEITDALSSGKYVYVYQYNEISGDEEHIVLYIETAYKEAETGYTVTCKNFSDLSVTLTFTSQTEDGVLSKLT